MNQDFRPFPASSRATLAPLALFAGLLAGGPAASAAVVFGQLDGFEDGTTDGWTEGVSSPNPPTNVATGGPAGAGDHYLQNVSSGTSGAGSKRVTFNVDQWTGNFTAAGVTTVDAEMANFGATAMAMRVAVQDASGTEFASTNAVSLPVDGGVWHAVSFGLGAAGLTKVSGADSYSTTISGVTEFRFVSAAGGPSYVGDLIASTLGLDDVRALRLPGDSNFDGKVDVVDLGLLATNYGKTSGATWAQGDYNFDGKVDVVDLGVLATNYGTSSPAGSPSFAQAVAAYPRLSATGVVPEPASVGLAAVGALRLLARRRRA